MVTKALLGLIGVVVLAGAGLWGYNYSTLQMPMNKVLAESAEAQIGVRTHFVRYYQTDAIVFNITGTGGEQVAQRAIKLFFEFAATQKDRDFSRIQLALNNRNFMVVPGAAFKKLGEDFGKVPVVELVRDLGQAATLPGGRPVGSMDKRILKHFLGGMMPGPKPGEPEAPSAETGDAAPEAPPAEPGAAPEAPPSDAPAEPPAPPAEGGDPH